MMEKKYLLQPEKKAWKQGYFLSDENGSIVYEAKVLKQSILGSQTVEFINHLTNKSEQHKIGAVVTMQNGTGGMLDMFSTRSHFKIDGKKVWDYLHEQGVRIDSGLSGSKLGMSYTVTLDVITTEDHLDIAFLAAFGIAKTEQTFYN